MEIRLKYLCSSFSTPITQDEIKPEGLYAVYGASGLVGYKEEYACARDYLGIIKDGAGVGRVNRFDGKSSLLGTMAYLVPNDGINIEWLKYVIQSLDLGKEISSTTIPHIYFKDYGKRFVEMPSEKEQQRIADFLDTQCAHIDAVLEQTRSSIEEYKKLKSSLIDGAFNTAEKSECGYYKLNYIGKLKNGLNFTEDENTSPTRILGVGDFKNYMVLDAEEMFSQTPIEGEIPKEYLLKSGDIIFVRSNGSKELVGRSIMVNNITFPVTYSGFCIRFQNEHPEIVMNYYLLYYFRSERFREHLKKSTFGTNITNLSQDMLTSFRIPIPSIAIQTEVVEYLNEKTQAVDKLIERKQQFLTELESYKKSLIYEYVTGKKEVPVE